MGLSPKWMSGGIFDARQVSLGGTLPDITLLALTYWVTEMILVIAEGHGGSGIKNLLANTGEPNWVCSVPGVGTSPGEGNGIPLQNSCLVNPMDKGAWLYSSWGWKWIRHGLVTKEQQPCSVLNFAPDIQEWLSSLSFTKERTHFHDHQYLNLI